MDNKNLKIYLWSAAFFEGKVLLTGGGIMTAASRDEAFKRAGDRVERDYPGTDPVFSVNEISIDELQAGIDECRGVRVTEAK